MQGAERKLMLWEPMASGNPFPDAFQQQLTRKLGNLQDRPVDYQLLNTEWKGPKNKERFSAPGKGLGLQKPRRIES